MTQVAAIVIFKTKPGNGTEVAHLVAAAPQYAAGWPPGAHRCVRRACTGAADLPYTPADAAPAVDLASSRQAALDACQSGG
ncbi:hypothetical protein [Rhodanobacter sp. DHB23]|uniref:hypothetical protein n=1 Tax=Rhodanobacter sp. DHB23 TaxID=2775923 RepID=UPI0017850A93|nr:hypothetical protein [Rhodanobacter sp. DHB23]MBD8873704.1 hypothetical protein [Rhodanobacter sp. DHB23]